MARSVYKLEEMDRKHRLLKEGDHVLDLGASPGSWSQYASKRVGPKGFVLGIDLQPIKVNLENAVFFTCDLRDLEDCELRKWTKEALFDVVLSDMAPKTTGIRSTDQMRSFELCNLALDVAETFLREGWHFVCKLFHSEEFLELKKRILEDFEKFYALKPESTRSESKEIFLIGMKFKKAKPKKA